MRDIYGERGKGLGREWPATAREEGEVGLIIQPHGYGAGRTYWYETLVRPNDVSATGVLQCLPVETFVKMIERLIEPALLRASSAEGPGLSPWVPLAAGWLRVLDCIADRDC